MHIDSKLLPLPINSSDHLPSLKPYQNCIKTSSFSDCRIRTPFQLARLPVQLVERLAFHLKLHLGILLEHHRIALPEQLHNPLVRNAPGAEPCRIRRTKIVQPEVRYAGIAQRRAPNLLEALLIPERTAITGKK